MYLYIAAMLHNKMQTLALNIGYMGKVFNEFFKEKKVSLFCTN